MEEENQPKVSEMEETPNEKKISNASTNSNVSSSSGESDSGLSGIDLDNSDSAPPKSPESSLGSRPESRSGIAPKDNQGAGSEVEETDSALGSRPSSRIAIMNNLEGKTDRRTQSVEVLTEEFSSRAKLEPSVEKGVAKVGGKKERHAHFADELERSRGVSSPALSAPPTYTIGYSQMPREARIRKSMSIPVHLTVSKNECRQLPYNLRPNQFCEADPLYRHDRDCAIYKDRTCPRSVSYEGVSNLGGIKKKTWKKTIDPTRIPKDLNPGAKNTISQTGPTKALRPVNTNKIGSRNGNSSSNLKPVKALPLGNGATITIPADKSGINGFAPDQQRNGYMKETKSSLERNKRTKNKRRKIPSAVNAELQIWEIQRELRRGEMVQGVLQLGPRSQKEETCICAPVTIGRTDGQMVWRSM